MEKVWGGWQTNFHQGTKKSGNRRGAKKKIRAHQGELHFPPDGREVLESNGATLSKSVDHLVQNVLDVIGKAGHQLDLVGQHLAHSLWSLHC